MLETSLASFITEHEQFKILEPSMFCKKASGKSPTINPSAAVWETIIFNFCYLQSAGSQIQSALIALSFRDR